MGRLRPPVHVLLVDDQAAFRAAARMVVENTPGFVVAGEAASGEEAIRLATRHIPELVLLDLKMPGMDGMETIRRLREKCPGLRVIALSTYEEYAEGALDAGAQAFLPKAEFTADRLLELV